MFEFFTEAHEAPSSHAALKALQEKIVAYLAGDETYGVLAMYEQAAHDLGCNPLAIQEAWAQAKRIKQAHYLVST